MMAVSNKPSPLRLLLAFVFLSACIGFIWYNSLQPPSVSSAWSKWVANWLGAVLGRIFGPGHRITQFAVSNIRKLAHFMEFALLGGTCAITLWILGWTHVHAALHVVLLVLLVAVADETIQIFTGRGDSVADIVLDFAGGMTGFLGFLAGIGFLRLLFGKKKRSHRRETQ